MGPSFARYEDVRGIFQIGEQGIGAGQPCFVVAEVAQAHDGSLGAAHAYIDLAARCGADAVKFQTHIADAESTPDEPFRVTFSTQDKTRYDYWKRMEFSSEQWRELCDHAQQLDLVFLSSPFSAEAVDLLENVGVEAYKVASGEVTNTPLLRHIAATGKPVILSSGMSTWEELAAAVALLRGAECAVALLQCTSKYPCPPQQLGLHTMTDMKKRFECPVGLSDHSGLPYAGIAAATLGAAIVEAHIVFSKDSFGPDTSVSLDPDGFRTMVAGVHFAQAAVAHTVDKDSVASELAPMREMFGRSAVAKREIPRDHRLTADDIQWKKPGGGIGPENMEQLLGCRTQRSLQKDERMTWEALKREASAA